MRVVRVRQSKQSCLLRQLRASVGAKSGEKTGNICPKSHMANAGRFSRDFIGAGRCVFLAVHR
jgi:hypothetical protein